MTTTHYIPDTTAAHSLHNHPLRPQDTGLEVRDGKVTVRVPDRLPEAGSRAFRGKAHGLDYKKAVRR